jgi:hypothetical protein
MSAGKGEETCMNLAISIAVACREPPKKGANKLDTRCGSAPCGLDLLGHRRSPQQARHRFQRRRGCQRTTSSVVDLTALDFSLKGAPEELKMVSLNEHDVSAKGVGCIARALVVRLSDSVPLTELHLAYNQLGDEGIASISWAAMQGALTSLTRLVLTGNRLSRLSSLATACRAGVLPSLKVLYLSSNRITSASVVDLAATALPNGKHALDSLTQLWLDHNNIGEPAAVPKDAELTDDGAHGLPTGGDQSIQAIAAVSRACKGLHVLNLSSNKLNEAHLDAITEAIASGEAFSASRGHQARVDVSLNTCSRTSIRALDAACASHGGIRLIV